jgi:hypothetical protein
MLARGAFTARAELFVFGNFAGIGIEGVAMQGVMVRHGVVTRLVGVGKNVCQNTCGNVVEAFALGAGAMFVCGGHVPRGQSGTGLRGGLRRMHGACCRQGLGRVATALSASASCADCAGAVIKRGADGDVRQGPKSDELASRRGRRHPQRWIQRRRVLYGRAGRGLHPQWWLRGCEHECCGGTINAGYRVGQWLGRYPLRRGCDRREDGGELGQCVDVTVGEWSEGRIWRRMV